MKYAGPGVFVVVLAGTIWLRADADLSGRWVVKQDRDYRGHPGVAVECSFTQKGTRLTVRCGSGSEMLGEVRGRKVTWGFEKTIEKDRVVLSYAAESNTAATSLEGTWTLKSSVLDERGTFEATR